MPRAPLIQPLLPLGKYWFLKRFYLFIFRQRGREGEREGEKHQCAAPLMCPLLGAWPAIQTRALVGNRTGDPLVHRPVLNPLSHTSQGQIWLFYCLHCFAFSKIPYSWNYVVFSDCPLSLDNTHLRFLRSCIYFYKLIIFNFLDVP